MQSNENNAWTIFDRNFNAEGLAELIFDEKINQTFLIDKNVGENRTADQCVMAARIVGMIEYRNGGKISGVPAEVSEIISQARRSRNSPIAPSRNLTPGWVRPYDAEHVKSDGGVVHRYSEEFTSSLWLGFIAGQSDYCQFGFHLNRLGLMVGESWQPAQVSTFQEPVMRRELEVLVINKKVEQFKGSQRIMRASLAGLETLGCVPLLKLKNGDHIKFSECEMFFEIFDPERHVGAIMPGENITRQEKRQLSALVNLIEDCKDGEEEYVAGIVDKEVIRWKEEWVAGAEWLSANIPFGGSVEKTDLDTINHPIIETFIDVGVLKASTTMIGQEERIFVTPTSAGYTICSAVLNK